MNLNHGDIGNIQKSIDLVYSYSRTRLTIKAFFLILILFKFNFKIYQRLDKFLSNQTKTNFYYGFYIVSDTARYNQINSKTITNTVNSKS